MSERHPHFQAPPRAADVYAEATTAWTVAALERKLGFRTQGQSDLEAGWLDVVRLKPIADLPDDDLARLLARGLHIPLTLPLALTRLRNCVESLVEPDVDLVVACGVAAGLARRNAPGLTRETVEVLQAVLRSPWTGDRASIVESVCAALDSAGLPPPAAP